MKTMYLIRHGLIENPDKALYGRSIDLLLSSEGEKQIQALAKKMKSTGEKIEAIYSSPLLRAQKTAQIIADEYGVGEVRIKDELTDVDIPALVGKSLLVIHKLHHDKKDEYEGELVMQGNEPRAKIAERMYDAWKKILEQEKKENIAIVSHGHPLRFLMYKITNPNAREIPGIWSLFDDDYMHKGEALKVVVDDDGNILEKKRIQT